MSSRGHCSIEKMEGVQAWLVVTGMAPHACWSALPDALSGHTNECLAAPWGPARSLTLTPSYGMHWAHPADKLCSRLSGPLAVTCNVW